MREKIERFANGNFEYEKRTLTLSDSRITFTVPVDGVMEGEFQISGSGKHLKGIVYASSSRMKVENPSFYARNVRIRYTFDARGMYGSEEEEGFFTLVTDAGEYKLPYHVTAEMPVNTERESYAYFITADPIEPLPDQKKALEEAVVEIIEEDSEVLSEEEALRLVSLILKSRQLQKSQFNRLIRAYETYENKELLAGILSILIKNERLDKEAFAWYLKGVKGEVKITNLYEYFIQAAPDEYPELLPRNVLLYFLYNNTLSAGKKAFIYANVVRYEDSAATLYKEYRKVIEPFMLEQLLQRKITEDMAVLYGAFLVDSLLTIDFAEALADIMFIRKLECKDPRIKNVQVFYEPLSQRVVYPVKNGRAYIPIYTAGAKILLMDAQENCYTSSVPYTLTRLLEEQRYIDQCKGLLKYHTGLYLHLCDGASRSHVLNKENVDIYKQVLKIDGFTESYRQEVRQEIMQFYYANHDLEELDEEFFSAQTDAMLPTDRAKFAEILILRGLYEKAWELILRYGFSLVRAKILVRLAAWKIRDEEYEQDEYLLKLCHFVFQEKKFNENILEYLAGYFQGDMDSLLEIWRAGCEFEIDVFELEERILSQMLFTEQYLDKAFEIFVDYERTGGNSLVSNAYLSYLAHEDFVLDHEIPREAFQFLEMSVAWDVDLPDVCKLSYLRYLAGLGHLSESQQIRGGLLTKEFLYRKLRFGFMKSLMKRLGKPHILEDKSFVEYRANPEHKVVIHYVLESPGQEACSYVAERMYPSAAGVFVKEFTLFYGERLIYFITETKDDGNEISTQDYSITGNQEDSLETGSKYAAIYEMCRAKEEGNEARLMEQLQGYRKQQYLVETLFRLK